MNRIDFLLHKRKKKEIETKKEIKFRSPLVFAITRKEMLIKEIDPIVYPLRGDKKVQCQTEFIESHDLEELEMKAIKVIKERIKFAKDMIKDSEKNRDSEK